MSSPTPAAQPSTAANLREARVLPCDSSLMQECFGILRPFTGCQGMTSLISSYNQLASNIPATVKRVAQQPQMKREIAYYTANIGKIKSVEDFMANERIYNFALQAYGLEDMQYAKAFIRKVLTEGIDSPQAFSVNLADQRFREFAAVFNFKRYGTATTSFDRTQGGVVERYLRNGLESQSGQQSEALRLALYFERKASTVTSAFSILADKALYQVARTALGMPDAISGADIDKQAAILAAKIDIEKLDDAAYVKKLITRFLGRYEAQNAAAQSSPAIQVLAGGGSGIDMRMIQSLQQLKRFGA
jgi:Protein of unknown function (DUF1217)